MAFEIKVGDTKPKLVVRVRNPDGTIPTFGGSDVVFSMRKDVEGADYKIEEAAAEVLDLADAQLAYEWQTGDTDEAGDFLGEFTEENGDGIATYPPQRRFVKIRINEKL